MGLKRLCQSLAWKLLPHAGLEVQTPGGLSLLIRDKGEWSCLGEIFVERVYEPFWPHLRDVRGWVDLGCNVGFFSLAMLDGLTQASGQRPRTRAFLGDANRVCLATALDNLRRNGLGDAWTCEHVVAGPPGATVTFSQFKNSIHSGILSRQKGERTFYYPTTDLKHLFDGLRDVFDLIKIDIEGAEVFVFRHYAETLRRFRFGLCEWHAPDFTGPALRTAIQELGFEVRELRSQPHGWDRSRGHSWESPLGMVLWRNPSPVA